MNGILDFALLSCPILARARIVIPLNLVIVIVIASGGIWLIVIVIGAIFGERERESGSSGTEREAETRILKEGQAVIRNCGSPERFVYGLLLSSLVEGDKMFHDVVREAGIDSCHLHALRMLRDTSISTIMTHLTKGKDGPTEPSLRRAADGLTLAGVDADVAQMLLLTTVGILAQASELRDGDAKKGGRRRRGD